MTLTKLKATLTLTVALIALLQSIGVTSDAQASSHPSAVVDLRSEERFLDAFVTDLGTYDKKSAGDDLTRRVSAVQNAFREVIRKLKAAGAWDDLDQE